MACLCMDVGLASRDIFANIVSVFDNWVFDAV
jgi:hypothetical protein